MQGGCLPIGNFGSSSGDYASMKKQAGDDKFDATDRYNQSFEIGKANEESSFFGDTPEDYSDLFTEHTALVDDKPRMTRTSARFSTRKSLEVRISASYYCRFLIYHILFFWIFGPFINLWILIGNSSKRLNLMKNMAFFPSISVNFINQLTNWAGVMICYWIMVAGFAPMHFLEILYTILTQTLLRISSIAGKYSTFSDFQVTMLYERSIPVGELRREYIMTGWRRVEAKTIKDCLNTAMATGEIQTKLFQIRFIR